MRDKDARPLDRTKLVMVPRLDAARAAFEALHPVQSIEPERMLLGVATLFATLCYRCQVEPQQLHEMGLKVLKQPFDGDTKTGATLEALRDFAGIRVMGQDVSVM